MDTLTTLVSGTRMPIVARLSVMSAVLGVMLPMPEAGPVAAGGSHYTVAPGTRPNPIGTISEWAVPTPKFARDPAAAPDGNICVAVMYGNKIARSTRARRRSRSVVHGRHNSRLGVIE